MYGVFSLVVLVATLAGAIFYLGASSALARSYYDYADETERRAVVMTSLLITLSGASVQVLLGGLLSPFLSQRLFGTGAYSLHFTVAFASSAITFVNTLFYMLLRFERKSVQVIAINLAGLLVTTIAIVLLLSRAMGVMAPLLGTLAGQLLTLLCLAVACRAVFTKRFSPREIGIQLRFGIPAIILGLAYYMLDSIDRVLINHYYALDDVGVYSLGYRLGMLVSVILVTPFSQIWMPMRMQYRTEPQARDLFSRILTYYCGAGLLIILPLAVFAPEVVAIIGGRPEYSAASRVLPFILFAHLIYGAVNIMDNGLIFERKVIYNAYVFIACVALNVGLNALLLPRYGMIAAAWVTLISYIALTAGVSALSNRYFHVAWDWVRIGTMLATVGAAAIVGPWVTQTVPRYSAILRTVVIFFVLFGWYRWLLLPEENHQLRRIMGVR